MQWCSGRSVLILYDTRKLAVRRCVALVLACGSYTCERITRAYDSQYQSFILRTLVSLNSRALRYWKDVRTALRTSEKY